MNKRNFDIPGISEGYPGTFVRHFSDIQMFHVGYSE